MKYLKQVADFLSGKKTYIVAILVSLVILANQLGYLDVETTNILLGLLGASGLAALRAGVSKTS